MLVIHACGLLSTCRTVLIMHRDDPTHRHSWQFFPSRPPQLGHFDSTPSHSDGCTTSTPTIRLVAVDLNDVVLVLVIIVLVSKREVVLIEHRRVDDFGVRRWRSRYRWC